MKNLMHKMESFPWATMGRDETSLEFFRKHQEQRELSQHLPKRPFFSIIWNSSNQDAAFRELQSIALKEQSYPHFELLKYGERNSTKADAIRNAVGEWIVFVGENSILSPVALFFLASELQNRPDAQLLYFHEVIDPLKSRNFFSKPNFSWFNLIHFDFIGETWAAKRKAIQDLSPYHSQENDYCFFLTLSELTREFHLVPFFLNYRKGDWEATQPKTETLKQHLVRIRFPSEVVPYHGGHFVRPKLSNEEKMISAIICFRDKIDWTIECVRSLCGRPRTCRLEVILVDNQSSGESLHQLKSFLSTLDIPHQLVNYDAPFNFAQMNRLGAARATGEFLLLLNNDVFLNEGNLDDCVAWASLDWVGTVGMRLHYKNRSIQHSGIRAFFGGLARLTRIGNDHCEKFAWRDHTVFGNTFAACMIRKELFENIGLTGWRFPNGFGDVAFNLECRKRSLENLYLGHLSASHLESASRGVAFEYWEECELERLYPELLQKMLREDLGWNRIAESDHSMRRFMDEWLRLKVRHHLPWVKPSLQSVKEYYDAWSRRPTQIES